MQEAWVVMLIDKDDCTSHLDEAWLYSNSYGVLIPLVNMLLAGAAKQPME